MNRTTPRVAHRTALSVVLLATAAAPAAPLAAQMPMQPPPPAITVQGTAEVRVPSDRAHLNFMVETQARTAREAAEQNAERVVRAVRDGGGSTVTVETGGYELHPVYTRPPRDEREVPTIEAYRAVNRVRADNVARVGALIDVAIGAGANRISSLTFEARDPEPAQLEAVRQAVAKARAEAEAVAGALGVPLGPPLEVNVGMDFTIPPPMPMMRNMAYAEAVQVAATPVEPGEQVVRANVSVRYRIGQ